MLCCVGLFVGVIAGAHLGMPWAPYITIPLGAAGRLFGDITIFRARKKNRVKRGAITAIYRKSAAMLCNFKSKAKEETRRAACADTIRTIESP